MIAPIGVLEVGFCLNMLSWPHFLSCSAMEAWLYFWQLHFTLIYRDPNYPTFKLMHCDHNDKTLHDHYITKAEGVITKRKNK